MKKLMAGLLTMAVVFLAGATTRAQDVNSKSFRDAAEQSKKAADVLNEIMATPDQAIPNEIFEHADCVLVFPDVVKAAFIVGGQGGRGVGSCKTADGWSAPAYFKFGGGSFGFQIGAQSTDIVLVVMNKEGMEKLLGDHTQLGADASVAAGPVGREAGLSTNARMDSEIVSYSRSKGLFAGVDLKGAVIKTDQDDMEAVYGPGHTARDVMMTKGSRPGSVLAFPGTLSKYSNQPSQ